MKYIIVKVILVLQFYCISIVNDNYLFLSYQLMEDAMASSPLIVILKFVC